MTIIEIESKEHFWEETRFGTVVVDFWAAWCAPCRKFEPEFHAAADAAQDVKFLTVDVDAHSWAMVDYGVRSIPNVQVWSGGEYIGNITPSNAKLLADQIDSLRKD